MSGAIDPKEYARLIGCVVVNLQSLEFALRAYLYKRNDPPHTALADGQTLSLTSLKVGETLPENAMTDYSTLDGLIGRYNKLVARDDPELQVDPSVVELRDAFAHGRISTTDLAKPYELLKFSKPSGGIVTVTYARTLTIDWLNTQAKRVAGEFMKISKAPETPMTVDPGPRPTRA